MKKRLALALVVMLGIASGLTLDQAKRRLKYKALAFQNFAAPSRTCIRNSKVAGTEWGWKYSRLGVALPQQLLNFGSADFHSRL